jgi:hypothetical protein
LRSFFANIIGGSWDPALDELMLQRLNCKRETIQGSMRRNFDSRRAL